MDDFYNDYIKDISDNAVGYGVSFLNAYLNEDVFSPEHSYHLHFLFSYDEISDRLKVLCLDNLSHIIIDQYSPLEDKDAVIDETLFEISKDFTEKLYICLKTNNMKKDNIFCRADQKLWDKFNDLKESLFLESMKDLSLPKNKKTAKFIPYPDLKYKYANEDKFVSFDKKQIS